MSVSASIYESFSIGLSRFYLEMYGSLMDSFGLFLKAGLVLYIVYVGYKFILNEKEGKDSIKLFLTCLMVSAVYVAAFESSTYFNYFIRPTLALFTDILTFLFGIVVKVNAQDPAPTGEAVYLTEINSLGDLFTSLDIMALEFIKSCKGLLPSSWGLLNPAWAFINLLAILLLVLVYLAMYMAFVFLFITSYFMMWLLFYVGGIVLILACFKETRGIFFGWLKMLFNYALIAIFTAMVVAVCYSGISRAVFKMSTYTTNTIDFTGDFLGLFIWCILCFTIVLKVPDIASGFTNAMASGTSGVAGMASAAGGKAMGMSSSASMGAAKMQMGVGAKIGQMAKGIPAGGATELLKSKLGIK